MNKKHFLFIFSISLFSIVCSKEIKTLTLDKAIEIAYKNRPSIKAYKFATQASRYVEKQKLSGYFPQLTLSEKNYFANGVKGSTNQVAFNASQLIYSFASPLDEYKIAKKGTEITKYSEETHKEYIRNAVEKSFLNAWLLQKKHTFIKTLQISAQTTFSKNRTEKKVNLLSQPDWLQKAATYSQNELTVALYSDDVNTIHKQLEYYLGKSINLTFHSNPKAHGEKMILQWNAQKKIRIGHLNNYYDAAIKNRKEIKSKQKQIEQHKETSKLYKNMYLPSLNAFGQVEKISNHNKKMSIAGLSLSWNLFDGGKYFQQSQETHANMLKATMEKQDTIQQIKFEVESAYYALSQALKQLLAYEISLKQAISQYKKSENQHKIGQTSNVELKEAKCNLQTAKYSWLEYKVNATIKEKNLMYYCGYPENI